jgi:death-on-curing protein
VTNRIEPKWIRPDVLVALTAQSIMLHGGTHGMVKYDLLESALYRPQHLWHYEQVDDMAMLAATYVVGISQNHPFTDGNKRAAYLAMGLFLEGNNFFVTADPVEAVHMILNLAKNECDQVMSAAWIAQNMEVVKK